METRSRELPLTAAKPIYLRPRSLLPSPSPPPRSRFSVSPRRCRSALRALPLPFLRHLSSSGPRCICYPPLARSRSAGLPTRLQRGSCLTRGYFTFPCSPAPRSRTRVAPGYARSVSNRGLTRGRSGGSGGKEFPLLDVD